MRISDGSSDVCSSDLTAPEQPAAADPPAADPPVVSAATPAATQVSLQCYAIGPFSDAGKLAAARRPLQPRVEHLRPPLAPPATAARRAWHVCLHRTSVLGGKGVSVSVGIGGGGCMHKKPLKENPPMK